MSIKPARKPKSKTSSSNRTPKRVSRPASSAPKAAERSAKGRPATPLSAPDRGSKAQGAAPRRAPAEHATRTSHRPIGRALISVYDKDGIVEFARELSALGIEILSTGGTARLLLDSGIPVERIANYTGFPEMLDGRVKTLHPKIHAGILAVRSNEKHMADIERHGIDPIDLVVVNLYPFEKTASMPGVGFSEIVEMIDVGGPTMVRAAAKNFHHVGIVVDPLDYRRALSMLAEHGGFTLDYRFDLARKAFRHVAAYDTAIFSYLSGMQADGTVSQEAGASPFPDRLSLDFIKIRNLRYGENPHQSAAFYSEIAASGASVASALKLQGKELSYNNIADLDAAISLVSEFDAPACAIIKHLNPCGVGLGGTAAEAYTRAFETDPVSAFGGVIGFNVPLDRVAAEALAGQFVEAIIAPSVTSDALDVLSTKKQLRLLEVGSLRGYHARGLDMKRVNGGLLVQDWDTRDAEPSRLQVVTRRKPTHEEMQALQFAWKIAKHVRSNAIVYALKDRTLGVGAGQMSRVDSARFGALKSTRNLAGSVIASDAFFPFRDGLDEAAGRGVTAVIQPGGSVRDAETIAAADEHGMAMVFTGYRHFKH